MEGKTVVHMFLKCTYYVDVWVECCKLLGLGPECRWEGASILQAWERWRRSEKMEIMTVLPLLVTWDTWLSRNNLVFNGKECTPAITAGMVCGTALALPKHLRVKNQREILALEIDKTSPWVFFMVLCKIIYVEEVLSLTWSRINPLN